MCSFYHYFSYKYFREKNDHESIFMKKLMFQPTNLNILTVNVRKFTACFLRYNIFPNGDNIRYKLISYNTVHMKQLKLFVTEAYPEKTQLLATLPVRSCFLYQAAQVRITSQEIVLVCWGEFAIASLIVSIFYYKRKVGCKQLCCHLAANMHTRRGQ
jgi:hypothetical protein